MFKDIAIIGVSLRMPQADNMEEFHRNLMNKKDCICPVSLNRRNLSGLDSDKEYLQVGYLEGIEFFDNQFFNISSTEAKYMCPEQRICLELAAEAIMSAGYSLKSFRGCNCAVYVSTTDNEYSLLTGQDTAAAFTGNLKSLTAGRISYCLDLRGPGITLDASCASTLVAVHEGCMKLVTGESEYALAGGLSVNIHIPEYEDSRFNTLGVVARNGRSKSFDADAQGTGIGEGGGFILLKPYEKALADKDYIYGVIKGSALSGDGNRKSSLTAPSVQGQKETILSAWRTAGIHPEEMTDMETHGTGTLIGDPIEIEGLQKSFNEYTQKKQYVYLGTVKSSIGHLAAAAGIAAIIKCITQYENLVSYPLVHFQTPNPYINFKETALRPTTEVIHWEEGRKRLTGISSFGFSGTNVHMILQNHIHMFSEKENHYLLKLSADSVEAFVNHVQHLMIYLRNRKYSLKDITATLNTGRDDYKYRRAIVFCSEKEACEKLEKIATETPEIKRRSLAVAITVHPGLNHKRYLEQVALYKRLRELVLDIKYIFTDEYGKLVITAAEKDEFEDEQQIESVKGKEMLPKDYTGTLQKIKENILLLQFGESITAGRLPENTREIVMEAVELYNILKELYEYGMDINWNKLYFGESFHKVPAPTYPFEKEFHWIYPAQSAAKINPAMLTTKQEAIKKPSAEELEEQLRGIWTDVLEENRWKEDESFFDWGGNSLSAMTLLDEIKKIWGIEIPFEEIYMHESFRSMKTYLLECMENAQTDSGDSELGHATKHTPFPLNSLQLQMYYSCRKERRNSAWNLSMAVSMEGRLDIPRFEQAMQSIIDRHECFRTIFYENAGIPYQVTIPEVVYRLTIYKMEQEGEQDRYEEAARMMNEHANTQLPLLGGLPYSFELYHISDKFHLFFMNIHHLISDGSSLVLFVKELTSLYLQQQDLDEELFQQRDFNCWIDQFSESAEGKQQQAYWLEKLKNLPPYPLYLNSAEDKLVAGSSFGEVKGIQFSRELYEQLNVFSQKRRLSMFSIILAAYHLWISHETEKQDVYCTTVLANRRRQESKNILGCLANPFMTRSRPTDDLSLRSLLGELNESIIQSIQNQEYPFMDLMCKVRGISPFSFEEGSQFFIAFQNYKSTELKLGDMKLREVKIDKKGCKTDFSLSVAENGKEIYGMLEYNNLKYTDAMVEEFISDFNSIIQQILQKSEATVGELMESLKAEKHPVIQRDSLNG